MKQILQAFKERWCFCGISFKMSSVTDNHKKMLKKYFKVLGTNKNQID